MLVLHQHVQILQQQEQHNLALLLLALVKTSAYL
jgi:hypothetical protein